MIFLFTDFVKVVLKWKTEASGFSNGITDTKFDVFIDSFQCIEDVKLDTDNIKSNPGLRFIVSHDIIHYGVSLPKILHIVRILYVTMTPRFKHWRKRPI